MNKRILGSAMALILAVSSVCCFPLSAFAADSEIQSGSYKYIVSKGEATIMEYSGSEENVVIPDTLDGLKVTRIEEFSSDQNYTAKCVTIPDSVKVIGNGAFQSTNNIETLITGDGVEDIYPDAFYDCRMLTKVFLGKNVKSIYSEAFYGCSSLKSISLPKSVKFVGELSFSQGTAIKCYASSKSALEFCTDSGNKCTLIDKKATLTKASKGKKSAKVTWKKLSSVTGVQIAYSTSKTFSKKSTKTLTVKGTKTTSKTISKLKSKKKYYIRVRAYKSVKTVENEKGKTFCASWSNVKTVTTK